jgi:O-methyltransferase involved in polyketide biosynthesis/protein-S-isoprenylcysteine O-methyltransferase Ste14
MTSLIGILRWTCGAFALGLLAFILWSIVRRVNRPTGAESGRRVGWLHSPLFYAGASLFFFGLCVLLWIPLPGYPFADGLALAGAIVCLPGLVFVLWGRLVLGNMYFVSTGFGAQLFAQHRLITAGPYAVVRHPMYFGLILAAFGSLWLYQTWTGAFFILCALSVIRRALREEEVLAKEFGAEWTEYCARVPMLFPLLPHPRTPSPGISQERGRGARLRVADLPPVARTLLIPLSYRAMENRKPSPLLRDPQAVELLARFDVDYERMVKSLGLEQICTMMRTRQFDRWAAAFLKEHPGGIIVDLGCGLDARPARVDDGRRTWFGLDFPEVIEVRRNLLPDGPRERLIAGSILDSAWMDAVAAEGRPVFFIAEGVLPYLEGADVRRLTVALAERFPGSELGFDAINRFSVWIHKFHPAIRKAGVRLGWALENVKELESWSPRIHLVEEWDYYRENEPRLGAYNWMRVFPPFVKANYLVRYGFENLPHP